MISDAQTTLDRYEEDGEIVALAHARMVTCPVCGSADGYESWDEADVRAMPEEDRRDFGPFYTYIGGVYTTGTLYTRCGTCRVAHKMNSMRYELWKA